MSDSLHGAFRPRDLQIPEQLESVPTGVDLEMEGVEENMNVSDYRDGLDRFIPSSLLARTSPTVSQLEGSDSQQKMFTPPYPFPNMTVHRLMSWMNSGGALLSETKVSRLVKDVILAEDFDPKHLENFSVKRSLRELDRDADGKKITFPDDWIEADVTINIPTKSKEDGPRPYTIPGFHYRPLVEVMRAAFADIQAQAFHLFPFKRLWKDLLDGHEEWIFDELYTSDAWLEAQDHIQKLPREPGCSLERVIAGLMLFPTRLIWQTLGLPRPGRYTYISEI
ncbi:hypothetical protein CY34DRAFT_10634 [Suillus luteus UH-Slu-Lm8-n1]|uniref:Unplaced genomic scaffold CY34scaffold_48, whole genome shotgun sequence n=1 Tax=Suillus luteus UH-Slu-Lm8-n1 TaxID=930992 RepID=A0A0D0A4P3_9AGAM|nr:hypothetical protein CY34DRAFT_10634 [Suillus luteus UH-Slu-Lm8-n1]